eukprot:13005711-Ditylum_brightwellii.AAC.1
MRKSSLRNKVDLDQLIHLAKLLEVEDDPTTTLEMVDRKLTEAKKQLKTVQDNAVAMRDTHLEEMAKMRLKNLDGDLAA